MVSINTISCTWSIESKIKNLQMFVELGKLPAIEGVPTTEGCNVFAYVE